MKAYSEAEKACPIKDMECTYKYTWDQTLHITAKSPP